MAHVELFKIKAISGDTSSVFILEGWRASHTNFTSTWPYQESLLLVNSITEGDL
jgi:hypothetical protein